MAGSQLGVGTWAQPAGQDLTNKVFYFAKVDSSGNIVLAGAGDPAIGVIIEEATLGNAASVQTDNIAKVSLGTALAANARVESDGNGQARAFASGMLLGILLKGGNQNEIVPVKLI